MPFLYIFADKLMPHVTKVGTSSSLLSRYRQARCHTPRGIRPVAFYEFANTAQCRTAEAAIKAALKPRQRRGDVLEWFDMGPAEVQNELVRLGIVREASHHDGAVAKLPAGDLLYDDWREQRASHAQFKWRIFMFREESPERRLKVSYGALYDTPYRYAFTYNPYPVRLVAGFDNPRAPEVKSAQNELLNRDLKAAWTGVQERYGSVTAEEVGWLRQGVFSTQVRDTLAEYGLEPFDLKRPKPVGAPPVDSSLNPPTPIGSVPQLHRVNPCQDVYRL